MIIHCYIKYVSDAYDEEIIFRAQILSHHKILQYIYYKENAIKVCYFLNFITH